ncbi:ARCA-like protein [Grosmannia clavigera kw1407]|uniref:ARCA-like protein n=1 Tax=Grosmannia clavigera (strain kw1407 / UAMH 11150) TaxID=655863 RepID=F0XBA2_GROCL|nr:ARCA-like protein [Grosmannia clavigera kw1407]EFX04865.1 ARCA-like protein [Grosmannia clavigera kw1407]
MESVTRPSPFRFDPDQPWCRTRYPLTFVDENREMLSLYAELPDVDYDEKGNTPSSESDNKGGDDAVDDVADEYSLEAATDATAVNHMVTPSLTEQDWSSIDIVCSPANYGEPDRSSSDLFSPSGHATSLRHNSIGISDLVNSPEHNDPSLSPLSPWSPPSLLAWPLENAMEAGLFRHFIDIAARSFDLCDLERSFAVVVPWRAMEHAPLKNAMFAISAKQLSLTSAFDKNVSDRYYQRCLATLRPMLNDEAALVDENLFAATVILRNLEEIEVPLAGADTNTYLLGNSLFVKASAVLHDSAGTSAPILFSGLRRAAFLVAVRQEIYTAFVSQRSIDPSFSPFVVDMALDLEGDDFDWANRAVFLLADVLRFCYDKTSMSTDDTTAWHDRLSMYSQLWYEKKPSSLSPFYCGGGADGFDAADGTNTNTTTTTSPFPEVWLMSDAAATGLQHYHLSRILLYAFDPRAPRIGPGRATFARQQDQAIRQQVRLLVGIAKSNPHCRPNYVSACMGITVAGDRFEDRREQEAIMDFLQETEEICAWPTGTASKHLSRAWGW